MTDNYSTKTGIIRNFTPGWFASVMGTAVFVVEVFVFRGSLPFANFVQLFFLGLAAIMFMLIFIPWILRWIFHFDAVSQDLQHPVSASFFPTMPISLIILGIAFEKAGPLFLSEAILFPMLQALWILGTLGIGGFALALLNIYFRRQNLDWKVGNLGWLIPPVSALIVPVLGNSLAVEYAGTLLGTINFITSLIFLGIGGILFLFVMTTVFSRYMFHELPPSRLAPTMWIGIAPTAIMAIIAIKMIQPLSIFFTAPEAATQTIAILAKAVGIGLWGFAFFWLLLAITATLSQHRKSPLPFAMSWWAFTFPFGAFVVSTGVVFQATQAAFFQWVGLASLAAFLIVWGMVAARTVQGIVSGEIFKPAH
ncbi:MAG: hypothetical protein H8E28_07955 [Anaerolineae bacterium]|nr:hypothetical protein [Anaerolineae bacterium]MBL6965452.1 hypothetical protein [Anaerolineales bacterium]